MTQSNDLSLRVNRLENDNIDLKVSVSALIETVNLHQQNFETAQRNFETMQRNIEAMQNNIETIQNNIEGMQTEIRGIQLENRRLIERMFDDQGPEGET